MNTIQNQSGSNKYLQHRPPPNVAPPRDERMAKAQRWTTWQQQKKPGSDKPAKVPLSKTNEPGTWSFFHACRACLRDPHVAGLGFQMYGDCPICAVDLDRCVDPQTGTFSPIATELLAALTAAGGRFHVELSPSGKGIRIFAAKTSLPFHDFTNNDGGIEVYTGESPRYLTYTGALVPGFGEGPFDPLPEAAVAILGRFAAKWKAGAARADIASPAASLEAVEPLPELTQRDDWEKLHPKALGRLSKENREFLKEGALGSRFASASEQLFAVEQALLKTLKPPQVYQILISAPGAWGVALDHRGDNAEKAKAFIWTDIARAKHLADSSEKEKTSTTLGWKECDIEVEITKDGARACFYQQNAFKAFLKHPDCVGKIGWNLFDGCITYDRREATPADIMALSAWVTSWLQWPMELNRSALMEALTEAAKTRPWNPVAAELMALTWDGKKRFKKLAEAVAEDPTELDEELLRKWMIGFVARGMDPGCRMETILCLIEKRGGGHKTTFCRVMAGNDRYSDSPGLGGDKDAVMLRSGMRIIELGEGVAVRRSDRHELKLDITRTEDSFRPPYGRSTEHRKRGFVYVLTSNDPSFLRAGQDGLRRFWPISCRKIIDIAWITENREQLLAEGLAAYQAGEGWWWTPELEPETLQERQGTAVVEDFFDGPIQDMIADEALMEKGYTALEDIKLRIEGAVNVKLDGRSNQFLVEALHRHGMVNLLKRFGDRARRIWFHPTWKQRKARILNFKKEGENAPGDQKSGESVEGDS